MSTSEILRRYPERRDKKREDRAERSGRRLIRPKEAWQRLGIGKTKFDQDFIQTGRLRFVQIGPRSVGVVEHELDAVIDEMIAARDAAPTPVSCKLSERDDASGKFLKARGRTGRPNKEVRA